jgi:hypothetical protein
MDATRNAYHLGNKHHGKHPLGRLRRKREDNIKMDLKEIISKYLQMETAYVKVANMIKL